MAAPKTYDLEEMSIRDLIDRRLDELGVSKYRFANSDELDGVSTSTTFRYLNGQQDAHSESVSVMLRACGLKIVPDKKFPDWVHKLKQKLKQKERKVG